MKFSKAIISVLRNVIYFKGRASRSEYNFWMLFLFLIYSISIQLDPPSNPVKNQLIEYHNDDNQVSTSNEGLNSLYVPFESRFFSFVYFLFLLPTVAVTIRRFHDIGKSGWYILLPLSIIGVIPYHYWTCIVRGEEGTNNYGADPLKNEDNQ